MGAMRKLAVLTCAGVVLAASASACAPVAGGGGATSTTTTTTRFATGRVDGLTENRVCGGPVSPSGCSVAFTPASDRVMVVPHIPAVDPFVLTSGKDGRFTVELVAGDWTFTAAPASPPGSTVCPSVTATVVAGSTVPVTLDCTIEAP
jgi:hypothetical protein